MKKNRLVLLLVICYMAIIIFNGCTSNNEKIENINKTTDNTKNKEEKVDKYDPILMLVNDEYWVDENFIPNNLEKIDIPFVGGVSNEEMHMQYEAGVSLEKLVNGALVDGIELYGVSGYRSYELQEYVYETSVYNNGQEYTNKYVAIPGRSEHQIGLAMDLGDSAGNLVKNEPEVEWIHSNSHLYGFIVRYPMEKEDITGYNYEPWHIRYVGVDVATEIYNKNITMEEYFEY